jgi:hypothetical protein
VALVNKLIPSKSAALPVGTVDYTRQYQDQFSNILRLYFNQVDNFSLATATPDSGTTANRPTEFLLVGQFYYDTTLSKPIYWNGTVWKDSAGTTV